MDIHTIQYRVINNNTKFKDKLEVEFVTYLLTYLLHSAEPFLRS